MLLYLTVDGLLQPLGFSQVVRVVEGLARRGWPYQVFSVERPDDLADEPRVRWLRQRLAAAGVEWRFVPFDRGEGAGAAARNEAALIKAAVSWRGISGIHARAYHAGVAALARWYRDGTPYLFDARSYWFDERIEEGRWFTSPLRIGVARGVETQLFACARAVVALTELQASDVRQGRFGRSRHAAVECIPTCADFDDFRRRSVDECTNVPSALRQGLEGKLVLGLVGSINGSYLVDETLALARHVLERSSSGRLLVVSAQRDEYRRRLLALGLDEARFSIARANHDDMPQWLSLMHWGMLLLTQGSPAKRASMPTKLAEFLACGVRPIQFGCNGEVSEWVLRTGSGLVLPDVSASSLAEAASVIAQRRTGDAEAVARARQIALQHFSLEAGLDRYERTLLAAFGDLRRRPRARGLPVEATGKS